MKPIKSLLLTIVIACGISGICAQQTVSIYSPEYKAQIEQFETAGNFTDAIELCMTGGKTAFQDGALKTASWFYSRAERMAADYALLERLVEICDVQWKLYERSSNHKAALAYLKQYNTLRDSLSVVVAARQAEEELAAAMAASEESFEEQETEQRQVNPLLVYYIIIAALTLLLLFAAVISYVKNKRTRLQIAELEKGCDVKVAAPMELAVIADRVRSSADDMLRNCRKEGFDLRTEIVPLLADSRTMALTASNVVACYEEGYHSEPADVDIDKILKRAAKEFTPAAQLKGVTIEYKSTGRSMVETDGHMIELAIGNLVSNAVKYSSKGAKVALWIESVDRKTIVGIEDHGVGMAPEKVDALLRGETFESTEGTAGESSLGLGMAVCRKAAEFAKAEFEIITSEKGTTATFTFR